MSTERATRTVEALLDDAERLGGRIQLSHIERVLDRRKLDPAECLEVYRQLQERHVLEQSDPAEEDAAGALDDDVDSGEPTSDSDEVSDGVADAEEREPRLESIQRLSDDFVGHSLLSKEEEIELGRAIGLGQEMDAALRKGEITASKRSTEIVERGRLAREKMITSNLRLVIKVAHPYAFQTSLPFDDLVQEGILGLMRAVEKFDHTKGFKFSTYAFWWIRQSIGRAMADKGDVIRLPVHVQEKVFRLRKAILVLRRFNGDRNPRVKELANELHWPPEQIQFLLDVSRVVTSLDAAINDEDLTLLDVVADDDPGPADLAIAEEERERILEVLGSLTPQQRDVIVKRFGLDRVNERTLEEIGQVYGVTRERIRQIETKALKKLRHPTRTPLLRALFDGSESECEQDGQDREGEGLASSSAGGEK